MKLPFSAKPVKRIVPERLGAAAKPPLLLLGNKRTAGSDEARHPARVAKMFPGAPAQSDSK